MSWESEEDKQERIHREIQRKISRISWERREQKMPHNPYDQELRECASIESGDTEALRAALEEKRTGKIGKLAEDPLRSAKNIGIVILTLASRAAIRGGLSPETAFTIEDGYVQRIEQFHTEEEVDKTAREAEFYYASLVAKQKEFRTQDALCVKCWHYILQHIQEPLQIKKLAHIFAVTPEYLSSRFAKVTGYSLKECILREKVREAAHFLRYTEKSLDEISCCLSFSSQSHFGKVFLKYQGMTPKTYRNKYKK